MALLRPLCSLLIVLAFALGTVLPVPYTSMAHEVAVSTAEVGMAADCDHCDEDAAVPVSCAKAFCAGSALILAGAEDAPEISVVQPGPARDQTGSDLSRSLDPPPRTVLIG